MNLNDINTNTQEGKLLFAALAKLTTETDTDKTPDEVIADLIITSDRIFSNESFKTELTKLINRHGMDYELGIADHILANHLINTLDILGSTNNMISYYGRKKED